jgi:hypothetical protein
VREITPEGVDGFYPRWSPDGSKLVYQERDAATQELGTLVVVDVATGKRTTVTDLKPERADAGWWVSPTFTPDGEEILFQLPRGSEADAPWDLWLVPAAGGEQRPAAIEGVGSFDFFGDPDVGSHFAYEDGSGALIEADWSSLRNPRVLGDGEFGSFRGSPDGTRIVYLVGDEVHVLDTATGEDSLVARGDWPEWFDNNTLIISPA